jgi:DNA invertase Pin-like site-specific DNA recombinase
MPRLFCYGRASTDSQRITLLAQEEITHNYYKLRHSMDEELTFGGWFPDAAVTSKINFFERPKASEILRLAQAGDAIVVSNFDRAFRSVLDCDRSLRICNEANIGLIILDVDVNTQTPLGRAFMKMIAVLKELEREEISRRTREAFEYNRRHMRPSRMRCPCGWDVQTINGEKQLIPCEQDQRVAFRVVELYHQGVAIRRILEISREEKWPPALWPNVKRGSWSLYSLRAFYVAAVCGFQKVMSDEMPQLSYLMHYLALYDGQPPRLQLDGVSQGLFYTLPPMPGPPPIVVPPVLYRHLKQDARACRAAEKLRDGPAHRLTDAARDKLPLLRRQLIPTPAYPSRYLVHLRKIYLASQSRRAAQSSHTPPAATPASHSLSPSGTD